MKCSKAKNAIPLFVSGDLVERRIRRILKHLDGCSSCREELEIFEKNREALQRLNRSRMPKEFWNGYSQEIRIKMRSKEVSGERPAAWNILSLLLGLRGAPLTVPVAVIALLLGLYIGSLNQSGTGTLPAAQNNSSAGTEEGADSNSALEGSEVIPVNYPLRNLSPPSNYRLPRGSVFRGREEDPPGRYYRRGEDAPKKEDRDKTKKADTPRKRKNQ